MMRKMPSRLVTEWMAYFKLKLEEDQQRELRRKAESGANSIQPPKRRKR